MSEKWLDRLSHLQLAIVALGVLAPVAWMVLSSFKPSSEVTAYPPSCCSPPPSTTIGSCSARPHFARYALNSFRVSTGSTLIGLLLGVPAAFAVAGRALPGRPR